MMIQFCILAAFAAAQAAPAPPPARSVAVETRLDHDRTSALGFPEAVVEPPSARDLIANDGSRDRLSKLFTWETEHVNGGAGLLVRFTPRVSRVRLSEANWSDRVGMAVEWESPAGWRKAPEGSYRLELEGRMLVLTVLPAAFGPDATLRIRFRFATRFGLYASSGPVVLDPDRPADDTPRTLYAFNDNRGNSTAYDRELLRYRVYRNGPSEKPDANLWDRWDTEPRPGQVGEFHVPGYAAVKSTVHPFPDRPLLVDGMAGTGWVEPTSESSPAAHVEGKLRVEQSVILPADFERVTLPDLQPWPVGIHADGHVLWKPVAGEIGPKDVVSLPWLYVKALALGPKEGRGRAALTWLETRARARLDVPWNENHLWTSVDADGIVLGLDRLRVTVEEFERKIDLPREPLIHTLKLELPYAPANPGDIAVRLDAQGRPVIVRASLAGGSTAGVWRPDPSDPRKGVLRLAPGLAGQVGRKAVITVPGCRPQEFSLDAVKCVHSFVLRRSGLAVRLPDLPGLDPARVRARVAMPGPGGWGPLHDIRVHLSGNTLVVPNPENGPGWRGGLLVLDLPGFAPFVRRIEDDPISLSLAATPGDPGDVLTRSAEAPGRVLLVHDYVRVSFSSDELNSRVTEAMEAAAILCEQLLIQHGESFQTLALVGPGRGDWPRSAASPAFVVSPGGLPPLELNLERRPATPGELHRLVRQALLDPEVVSGRRVRGVLVTPYSDDLGPKRTEASPDELERDFPGAVVRLVVVPGYIPARARPKGEGAVYIPVNVETDARGLPGLADAARGAVEKLGLPNPRASHAGAGPANLGPESIIEFTPLDPGVSP